MNYLSYWDEGKPDGRNSNEDCIHMNGHIWGTSSGRWNNCNCQDRILFVCEFSVSEPIYSSEISKGNQGISM